MASDPAETLPSCACTPWTSVTSLHLDFPWGSCFTSSSSSESLFLGPFSPLTVHCHPRWSYPHCGFICRLLLRTPGSPPGAAVFLLTSRLHLQPNRIPLLPPPPTTLPFILMWSYSHCLLLTPSPCLWCLPCSSPSHPLAWLTPARPFTWCVGLRPSLHWPLSHCSVISAATQRIRFIHYFFRLSTIQT